jgi:peptidoglycan hydrolase CwlO-like protein
MKKALLFGTLLSITQITTFHASHAPAQPTQDTTVHSNLTNIKEEAQKLAAEINNIDNEIKAMGIYQKRRLHIR